MAPFKPYSFGEETTRTKKKKSDKQESELAKILKGKTQAGSGNQWHSKGDVETKDMLVECKCTRNRSYSLKIDTWKDIEQKAFEMGGKTPAMEILLGEGSENLKLFVLSEDDYLELTENNRGHGE